MARASATESTLNAGSESPLATSLRDSALCLIGRAKSPSLMDMKPDVIVARFLAAIVLAGSGSQVLGSDPVKMLFHCTSVKIEPATVKALGDHHLSFNFSDTATGNGELAVLADPAVDPVTKDSFLQGTGFTLTAPGFGVPIEGDIHFETPQLDKNLNGVDDIFEVALAQPATVKKGFLTFTTVNDEIVNGSVTAKWERIAGSPRGTVTLTLKFPGYSQTFSHTFEVFEYEGTLSYQRTGTNVVAQVQLERQGITHSLAGTWNLHVVDNDVLTQEGGAWVPDHPEVRFDPTTLDGGSFSSEMTRGGLNTNYFGFMLYSKGSPVSPVAGDFALWEIDLFDGNDRNRNRIPDLTDPELSADPAIPKIFLTWEADAPRLHLSGSGDTDYVVEKSDLLLPGDWSPFITNHLTSTNFIEVPLSTKGGTGQRFWRVRSW
jgi:hypothetical protein